MHSYWAGAFHVRPGQIRAMTIRIYSFEIGLVLCSFRIAIAGASCAMLASGRQGKYIINKYDFYHAKRPFYSTLALVLTVVPNAWQSDRAIFALAQMWPQRCFTALIEVRVSSEHSLVLLRGVPLPLTSKTHLFANIAVMHLLTPFCL